MADLRFPSTRNSVGLRRTSRLGVNEFFVKESVGLGAGKLICLLGMEGSVFSQTHVRPSALGSDSVTRVDYSIVCIKPDLIPESDWRVTATNHHPLPTLLPAGITRLGPLDQVPGSCWVPPSFCGDQEPFSPAHGRDSFFFQTPFSHTCLS